MKKKNRLGFTLVELVVVIAIIGVLAAILVPSMMNYIKKSRLKTANANAREVYNAMSAAMADVEMDGRPYDLTGVTVVSVSMETPMSAPSKSDPDYAALQCQYAAYKALSSNGDEAGIISYAGVSINGLPDASLQVQWCRQEGDEIIGQYPNPRYSLDDDPINWGEFENQT